MRNNIEYGITGTNGLCVVPWCLGWQREALELVDSLSCDPALRLDMTLQPGDVQFLHNHCIWHARSAYTDWPQEE